MAQADYDAAFAKGEDVISIGKLHLPSGRVVACDPFFAADARPFQRAVDPGDYEVQLRRVTSPEWGDRIALARLLVHPRTKAASFESAGGGYSVDSGIGSFMDDETRAAFSALQMKFYQEHRSGNYYTDVLEKEFKKSAKQQDDPLDVGAWALHRVSGTKLNIAMFASGLGDGAYASWWGLSAGGDVVSLVTDFGLL